MKKATLVASSLASLLAFSMHVIVEADIKVGKNANVISGIENQFIGDLFRQRQNESVLWISSINPDHRMVAYNDYRTVDAANDTQIGTPSPTQHGLFAKLLNLFRKPSKESRAHRTVAWGQAWIGLSFTDNATDWYTGLHPGSPFDGSNPLLFPELNPVPSNPEVDSAADPVVAGSQDRAYLAGIAYNSQSPTGVSKGFVSVWRDHNDTETAANIQWERGKVLITANKPPNATGDAFVDKPAIAAGPCSDALSGKVYAAFVLFDESDPSNLSSKIMFFRSTDCGNTWSTGLVVSEPLTRNQSPWIVIDSNNDNIVYIGWRIFSRQPGASGGYSNAIVGKKSTNGGVSFTPTAPYGVALYLKAFDMPQVAYNAASTPPQLAIPRSNSYPSAGMDGNGSIHVAFTEWVSPTTGTPLGPSTPLWNGTSWNGLPRVVVTSSHNGGVSWTPRKAIDFGPTSGTQFMPVVGVAGEPGESCPGKTGPRSRVLVMFYDGRASTYTGYITGPAQFDVRAAEVSACAKDAQGRLNFWASSSNGSSQLVSLYTRSATRDPNTGEHKIVPTPGCAPSIDGCAFSAVNRAYTAFGGGGSTFTGDYIHAASIPPYVKTASGQWKPTTARVDAAHHNKLPGASWQGVWADFRDAVLPKVPAPPAEPDPLRFLAGLPWATYAPPHLGDASCVNLGSRDQNVYAARMTPGLFAFAPVTFKPSNVDRDYPLVIENSTNQDMVVRLTISTGSSAQFNTPGQGQPDMEADVAIGAFSSVTGSAVVLAGETDPVVITVQQIATGIYPATAVTNGLKTSVTINTDAEPDLAPSSSETRDPVVEPEPFVTKPFGTQFPKTITTEIPSLTTPPPLGQNPPPLGQNPPPLGQNPPPLGQNPPPLGQNTFSPNVVPSGTTIYDSTAVGFVVSNGGSHAAAYSAIATLQNQAILQSGAWVFSVVINRISREPWLVGCFPFELGSGNQVSVIPNPPPLGQNPPPLGQNPPPLGQNPPPLGQNIPPADGTGAPNPIHPWTSNSTFYVAPATTPTSSVRLDVPGMAPKRSDGIRASRANNGFGISPASYTISDAPWGSGASMSAREPVRRGGKPSFTLAAAPQAPETTPSFRAERPPDEVVYWFWATQVQRNCALGETDKNPGSTDPCVAPNEKFTAKELTLTVESPRANLIFEGCPEGITPPCFDPGGSTRTSAGAQVATKLGFIAEPSNTTAGATIFSGDEGSVQVAVQDVFGSTVTTSTASITIAIDPEANPAGGSLSGTLTTNAINGVATFSNLSINRAGNNYRLIASATELTSATSASFDVAPVGEILIYGASLATSTPNEKTLALDMGYSVTVRDEMTMPKWSQMTTAAAFTPFNAIVFPDPDCESPNNPAPLDAAVANRAAWSAAATGPKVVMGTDTEFHFTGGVGEPTSTNITKNAINFAASGPGTGFFLSLSCYYWTAFPEPTTVPVLDQFGVFKVRSGPGETVQITAPTHPVMAGITSAGLSNWGNSMHEWFSQQPAWWMTLAKVQEGESSKPYIIAENRGVRGTVADADTPVSGAMVTARGPGETSFVTSTDAQGKYSFIGIPSGTYTLEFRKFGYFGTDHVVQVPLNSMAIQDADIEQIVHE